jgi:hypothetical protein
MLVSVGFLVLGVIVARRLVLVPAGTWWLVYFLGLNQRWWGSGVGDGWGYGLIGATALTVAAAAVGIAVGLRVRR